MNVSVTKPLDRSWERMLELLFRPFVLSKWFSLGFMAFLVQLGSGGSSNFNFNFDMSGIGGGGGGGGGGGNNTTPTLQGIWDAISGYVPLIVLAIIAAIGIWLLLIWLSSRARFVFIEQVVLNHAQISVPWSEHRHLGNSLFQFRLVVMICIAVAMALLAGLIAVLAWSSIQAETWGPGATAAIVVGIVVGLPVYLTTLAVMVIINELMPVVMYCDNILSSEAWRRVLDKIVLPAKGKCALFLLMLIALRVGAGIATMMAVCATCCIGAIPYIGTVITLPIPVFFQAYSIYYTQQFDPGWAITLTGTADTCPECGYDLRGNPDAATCPECGAVQHRTDAPPLPPPDDAPPSDDVDYNT